MYVTLKHYTKGKGKAFPLQARCGPESRTAIALLLHGRALEGGWVVSSTPRPYFTPQNDPVPILQEARWAPGTVWTGGKSRPHRDSISDRPARSQPLYRLSYQAHLYNTTYLYYMQSGRRIDVSISSSAFLKKKGDWSVKFLTQTISKFNITNYNFKETQNFETSHSGLFNSSLPHLPCKIFTKIQI